MVAEKASDLILADRLIRTGACRKSPLAYWNVQAA